MKLLFFVLAFPFFSLAQERISATLPLISDTALSKLESAIGWVKNAEGQWVSRPNKIPPKLETKFDILIDSASKYCIGIDNFISYEFRTVTINNAQFTILIKKYVDGDYKYPALEEEWESSESIYYYIFDREEIGKLKSLKDGSINLITINCLLAKKVSFLLPGEKLNDMLSKDIAATDEFKNEVFRKGSKSRSLVTFHIAPYRSKGVTQFQIYNRPNKSKLVFGIAGDYLIYGNGIDKSYGSDDLFKNAYFESRYLEFENFLKF